MLPTSLLFEITCLLTGITYLRGIAIGYWKGFIYYLIFIVIVETIGWGMGNFKIENHWLYNIELIVEFYFISWFFKKIFIGVPKAAIVIKIAALVFYIIFVVESIKTGLVETNAKCRLLAAVLFIIASGMYYYFLLNQVKHENLLKYPEFWAITGVFVYYFCSVGLTVFSEELQYINIISQLHLRYIILTGLNLLLYGCWGYSFRCKYLQTI